MISEQELVSAVVAVEQSLRDAEEAKVKGKHDIARLQELSLQILIDKTKLQVLHYAQGITGPLSDKELAADIAGLDSYLDSLQAPKETSLFEQPTDDSKEIERHKLVMRTKLLTLRFLAGEEKKIL